MPTVQRPDLLCFLCIFYCIELDLGFQVMGYFNHAEMGLVGIISTRRIYEFLLSNNILLFSQSWFSLTFYIFSEGRSISDFGYCEIELVLASILKRLWKSNPQEVTQDFFNRIQVPTWRTMKLVESVLLTMKENKTPDFSLDKQTHMMCLNAFNESCLLQVILWGCIHV